MVTDITNPFWTTVARGAEDTAAKDGYSVILCNTDEDPQKEADYLQIVLQRQVDGILIAPATDDGERLAPIHRQGLPCVILDRAVKHFKADAVRSDDVGGAYKLTQHLLHLGHRAIAMISGPAHISTAEERVRGYRLALQERGMAVDETLVRRGGYKQADGYRFTVELLARGHRPSAIFAANNLIAVGVMEALWEKRLRVPDDVAVVCFGDLPQAALIRPFLTVIAQPDYEIGAQATALLLQRLGSEAARHARHVVLETHLIIRESCGYLRKRRMGEALETDVPPGEVDQYAVLDFMPPSVPL